MSYKINYFIASDKYVAQYEKRLSICLSSNGFSFSVTDVYDELLSLCDVECNMGSSIGELLSDIRGILSDTRIQTFGLKDSELTLMSNQFVWVPQHLYEPEKKKEYLDVMCKVPAGYGVYEDYNDRIKAHIVFSGADNCVSAFKIAIPGIHIRCQHSKMVNATVLDASDGQTMMLVNLRAGETDFAIIGNRKLQISSTYNCVNFDETMFYALNLTRQLHLEDARMTVGVCGDVDRDRFALMRSYFPNSALYTGRALTLTMPEMQHIHTYRYSLILS